MAQKTGIFLRVGAAQGDHDMLNEMMSSRWTIAALICGPALAGAVINHRPVTINSDQLRIVLGPLETGIATSLAADQNDTALVQKVPLAAECPKSIHDAAL